MYSLAPSGRLLNDNINLIITNSLNNPALANIISRSSIGQLSTMTARTAGGTVQNFSRLSTRGVNDLLTSLANNSTPAARELYDRLAGEIVEHSMKHNSVAWASYKSNIGNQIRSVLLSPNAMKDADMSMLATSFAEYIPLIWNEAQDVWEKLGFSRDDPNGILLPTIDAALELNDSSLKKVSDNLIKTTSGSDNPEEVKKNFTDLVSIGKNAAGLGDTQTYDPGAEATGTYK